MEPFHFDDKRAERESWNVLVDESASDVDMAAQAMLLVFIDHILVFLSPCEGCVAGRENKH